MAMTFPRLAVFGGAIGALAVMTVLSAALGYALPTFLPKMYTHYASAVRKKKNQADGYIPIYVIFFFFCHPCLVVKPFPPDIPVIHGYFYTVYADERADREIPIVTYITFVSCHSPHESLVVFFLSGGLATRLDFFSRLFFMAHDQSYPLPPPIISFSRIVIITLYIYIYTCNLFFDV